MSVAADTILAIQQLAAGVPAPQVPFKGRLAVRTAHYEIAAGATQINQQPALFAAITTRAIADESNR